MTVNNTEFPTFLTVSRNVDSAFPVFRDLVEKGGFEDANVLVFVPIIVISGIKETENESGDS